MLVCVTFYVPLFGNVAARLTNDKGIAHITDFLVVPGDKPGYTIGFQTPEKSIFVGGLYGFCRALLQNLKVELLVEGVRELAQRKEILEEFPLSEPVAWHVLICDLLKLPDTAVRFEILSARTGTMSTTMILPRCLRSRFTTNRQALSPPPLMRPPVTMVYSL